MELLNSLNFLEMQEGILGYTKPIFHEATANSGIRGGENA